MVFGKVSCVTLKRKAEFRGCLFTISAHASPLRLNLDWTCLSNFLVSRSFWCTESYWKEFADWKPTHHRTFEEGYIARLVEASRSRSVPCSRLKALPPGGSFHWRGAWSYVCIIKKLTDRDLRQPGSGRTRKCLGSISHLTSRSTSMSLTRGKPRQELR